jgi:HD superfamily phosphohydrolase
MNRLQLVPQLLLYRSVTPGGVHTAFESLLGSYGMALKCVTKLLADPRFRESFSPKEHEEALVAILLSRVDKLPLDRIIRLVKPDQPGDRRRRLTELLSEAQDGGPPLREVIISKFSHVDIDAVIATLTADTPLQPYQDCTRSLIESSISARAMDYLQRDALHTGISAGSGIDAANLIESLRWSKTNNTLGISRSGVFSAEHLLSARYWMFIRLYWNTNNRAIAAMLRHVISEILSGDDISADYLTKQFSGLDEAGVLRAIDSHWANTAGHGRERSTIMELLKRPRPKPYEQLFDRFSRNWGKDKDEGRQKMSAFANLDAAALEFMRRDFLEKNGMTDEDPSIILFDYPSDGALKLGEDVLVHMDDGEKPLKEVSDIVALLPDTFNDTCVRLRVFHDPNLPKDKVERLRGAAAEYLDDWVKNAGKH